mgnify:CR=1 FL=1
MLDYKLQYMNNIINNYHSYGYNSLNVYDKYHIILTIVDYLSYNFRINLGNFIRIIRLPKSLHNIYPVLGLKHYHFKVLSLYNLSLCSIQRNRYYYTDNNYYNLKILRTKDLYTIHDTNNLIFEYILKLYTFKPKEIITFLINKYLLTINTHIRSIEYESDSDSETEEYDTESDDEYESDSYSYSYSESESESDYED